MVDSNDRERVGEAREELARMLAEDDLKDVPLLVFATKQVRSSSPRAPFLELVNTLPVPPIDPGNQTGSTSN